MSGSEAGSLDSAESFGSVGGAAEPSAEEAAGVPWWKAVCDDIAAGRPVEVVRASLAAQQQAQEFAREERLAAERAAQSRTDVEAQNSQSLFAALESRDRRIADLEISLQGLKDAKDDLEPEHREFVARALDNPFGVVTGSERTGPKGEPQLWHYASEKAFVFLEDKGGKDFYNFQALESAAEALYDVIGSLKATFPSVVEKLNPDGATDENDPQYIAERELCKVYNTVKAIYDNVINPQLSYLQVEAILHKKYGKGNDQGWITQVLSSIQKSIHGLIGTPMPENCAPKFGAAMQDLEERFSSAILKNAAQQASRTASRSPFQQMSSGDFGSTARSRELAGMSRRRPPPRGAVGR